MLSINHSDWPKLHDMFKARVANVWQCAFPVGFPVEVSALNLLFINGKNAPVLKRECSFSRAHETLAWLFSHYPHHVSKQDYCIEISFRVDNHIPLWSIFAGMLITAKIYPSHNASVKYPTMHHFETKASTHVCAHFCNIMLHCGILQDLCNSSIWP